MLPPVITETIERHWDGELLPEPIVRTLIPDRNYDHPHRWPVEYSPAVAAANRRYDYAEDKRIGRFGLSFHQTRMADWAFWQSGAIVTRDAVLESFTG